MSIQNKKKIINDPVYGFVNIPFELIFDLIEHPYFQRLRRIRQLGLSHYVYPGAQHTRFQHVIGAMSLTWQAVEALRFKGIEITEQEAEAVCAAVLLHDLGHGPFSHTLEHILLPGISHEVMSLLLMKKINRQMQGKLDMALDIFQDKYPKKFLHQLVSSQLDMDRLDYLRRDSFYTGVQEGIIGHDRIIKMLTVANGRLAVEEKGIYSIEKFIIARRLMYWQVYLHKTVIAAENLLIHIMKRARELAAAGTELFCTPALHYLLYLPAFRPGEKLPDRQLKQLLNSDKLQEAFTQLDDYDIFTSIKTWAQHPDKVLSNLCSSLIERRLPQVEIGERAFSAKRVQNLQAAAARQLKLKAHEPDYFVYTGTVENKAYSITGIKINIVDKQGRVRDIAKASDNYNISALTNTVVKHFLCFPKNL